MISTTLTLSALAIAGLTASAFHRMPIPATAKPPAQPLDEAEMILVCRYSRGEIDAAEYARRASALQR